MLTDAVVSLDLRFTLVIAPSSVVVYGLEAQHDRTRKGADTTLKRPAESMSALRLPVDSP